MNELQRVAVADEAATWLRTPYHHMGDIKGVGVDCAMLLVRVYQARGLLPEELDPRPYPAEWHLHRNTERYLQWVVQYGTLVETPQVGDMCIFKFGRTYSHGAILVAENVVIHSYLKLGVTLADLTQDPLKDRPVKFYTLNT